MQSLIWHVGIIDPVAIDLGIGASALVCIGIYYWTVIILENLSIYLAKSQNLNFSEEFLDNFFIWGCCRRSSWR